MKKPISDPKLRRLASDMLAELGLLLDYTRAEAGYSIRALAHSGTICERTYRSV